MPLAPIIAHQGMLDRLKKVIKKKVGGLFRRYPIRQRVTDTYIVKGTPIFHREQSFDVKGIFTTRQLREIPI